VFLRLPLGAPIKRGWGFHSASGKLSAKRTDEVE
jgi:hypothetical protein